MMRNVPGAKTINSPCSPTSRVEAGTAGIVSTKDRSDQLEIHKMDTKDTKDARARRKAPLDTPTNLTANATRDISGALTTLLADMFALYVKTKNFHWHVSGPHFRDYHLLL